MQKQAKPHLEKSNYKAEGTDVSFTHARDLSGLTCYHCGKKGHYSRTYPKKEVKKGEVHTQVTNLEVKEDDGDELGYI